MVVVLLARPVKDAVQNVLDRAFYRDRYDYRRALVGFARDLSTDLDLPRLAERLVTRITETLVIDRIALMVADEAANAFRAIRAEGFVGDPPLLPLRLRRRRARAVRAPRGARRPGRPSPCGERRGRVLAGPGRALPHPVRVQADGHRRAGPRAARSGASR